MVTGNIVRGWKRFVCGRVGSAAAAFLVLMVAGSCAEWTKDGSAQNAGSAGEEAGGAKSGGFDVTDIAEDGGVGMSAPGAAGVAAEHFGSSRAWWYANGMVAGATGSRAWCGVVMDQIAAEFGEDTWAHQPVMADAGPVDVHAGAGAPGVQMNAGGGMELATSTNVVAAPELAPVVVVEPSVMPVSVPVVVSEEPVDVVKSPMPIAPVVAVSAKGAVWPKYSKPWGLWATDDVKSAAAGTAAPVKGPAQVMRIGPPPPTATVSMVNRPTGAVARTVALLFQVATFAAILLTVAFALFMSPLMDQTGVRRRAFTMSTGFSICVGGAVSLLLGACWMGASSLAAIGGDSVLAEQVRLAVLAVAGIGLCITAGLWFSKSFAEPMARLMQAMRASAGGDFKRAPINSMARNELGELARAADRLEASVKDALTEVSISTMDLATAAEEIVAGTKEASANVSDVANRCAQTANAASEASHVADLGGQAVNQAAAAFRRIDESVQAGARSVQNVDERGREIVQIVDVIDDIADRTHLLALNASIQAAKAGPEGRALARLAEDVRRLAERAQNATEQAAKAAVSIQEESQSASMQIATGMAQIKQTAEVAARAGAEIMRLVHTTSGVSGAIQKIGAAAEDAGAGAVQAATAADQLSARADELKSVVGRFRLDTTRFLRHAAPSGNAGVTEGVAETMAA